MVTAFNANPYNAFGSTPSLGNLRRRIQQYQIATGNRTLPRGAWYSALEAGLGEDTQRAATAANAAARLSEASQNMQLRQDALDMQKKQYEDQKSAEKLKGLGQLFELGKKTGIFDNIKTGLFGDGYKSPSVETSGIQSNPFEVSWAGPQNNGIDNNLFQQSFNDFGTGGTANSAAAPATSLSGQGAQDSLASTSLMDGNPTNPSTPTLGSLGSSILPAFGQSIPSFAGSGFPIGMEPSSELLGQSFAGNTGDMAGSAAAGSINPGSLGLGAGIGMGVNIGLNALSQTELGQSMTPWNDQSRSGQMINRGVSGAAAGALSTWAAGAMAGTSVGPVGTIVGGLIGGIMGMLGGGGSIICTELNRQGYLDDQTLYLDGVYRRYYIDDQTYTGYLKIAEPLVKAMQKSRIVTELIAPLGVAWAKEMAHRIDPENYKGNVFGKIIHAIGVPVARFFGDRRIANMQEVKI